jgi:hypothetical protein
LSKSNSEISNSGDCQGTFAITIYVSWGRFAVQFH